MEGKITFFASFYETLKKLPEAQREPFMMGLLGYAFEGIEPDFADDLLLDIAFTNARPNLDASARKAKVARENGEAGGRPETKHKTNAKTDRKTNAKTNAKTQPLLEKEKEKEKERDMEKEVKGSFPLEEKNLSTDSADGGGLGMAAPTDGVVPTCPRCGGVAVMGIGGFVCEEHGRITHEEVVFR